MTSREEVSHVTAARLQVSSILSLLSCGLECSSLILVSCCHHRILLQKRYALPLIYRKSIPQPQKFGTLIELLIIGCPCLTSHHCRSGFDVKPTTCGNVKLYAKIVIPIQLGIDGLRDLDIIGAQFPNAHTFMRHI